MDAKKALYRAKLREAAQKREKRIDSPLVKYNEHDQLVCRVCNVVLKSESLWPAHQVSRKHHEAIQNFKSTATALTRNSDSKSEPSRESIGGSHKSSPLPAGFFDEHDLKRQKTGLSNQGENIAGNAKAPVKLGSISSGKKYGKIESSDTHGMEASEAHKDDLSSGPSSELSHSTRNMNGSGAKQVKGALPSDFFDNKDSEPTKKLGGTAGKQVNRALPDEFFDIDSADATKLTASSEVKEVKGALPGDSLRKDAYPQRNVGKSETGLVKGALPEGFFDNKDDDLRARGIEPVKICNGKLVLVSVRDEYKEFEKLIQEDLKEVDERWVEEEVDAADMREEEETVEQKAYWERVEMLKKKQMELKAAKLGGQKAPTEKKDSSDEEDSSSDEDGNEEDFAVDWRAKHL
ncbi:hypothetical protein Sjap_024538 [Stephania japonica]|uniref:C2H2-type domain-containing protein n=1 Tax=Stephania japonica TaxID=461633 RepID=A0AAP0EDJ8_9MAGN